MKTICALTLVLLLSGCTERDAKLIAIESKTKELETQMKELRMQADKIAAALPRVDRYKMFNGGVGAGDLAFFYDTQSGRVWRYYRNFSADHKTALDEGFMPLLDASTASFPTDRLFGLPSASRHVNLADEFSPPIVQEENQPKSNTEPVPSK